MSRLLERMRSTFRDELLVRSGRRYERTPRADQLLAELREILERLDTAITGGPFAPERCDTTFRIATTDYASVVLVPSIVSDLEALAPKASLEVLMWNDRTFDDIAAGRLDAAVGSAKDAPATLRSEKLFDDEYVCIVAPDHPLRGRRANLASYLAYPHAVIDVVRGGQSPVDEPLASRGLRRRVGYRTPFLSSAIFAVARTSMILTVPSRLAASYATTVPVRTVTAPREVAGLSYSLIWHKRLEASAAHAWFRQRIHAIAETAFAGHAKA